MEKNLPAKTNQNPIELVRRYKSDDQLVFVAEEDLQTQSMFLPEVVIIHSTPDDFWNISGKFMPKRHQKDRIAEAAGIAFLEENCGTRTEKVDGNTAYVGFAQGKKRMPDGTWRTSSICEYEFDPVKRAEEDILRDTKGKYKTEKDKKLHLLNLQKFGRARASTGARLRVINELTGMPTSLEPNQIKKAMVFARVAVNTDRLLEDPELKKVAIDHAMSASREIYGGTSYKVENGDKPEQIKAPAEEEETTEVPFSPGPEKSPEEKELEVSLTYLKALSDIEYLHPDAKGLAEDMLSQEKNSLDAINGLIEQIESWLSNPAVVKKHGTFDREALLKGAVK